VSTSKASRPTAADVARMANVSAATVSYVLNNAAGQRISGKTREAVLAAAEQLGYRPNLAARNLRAGRSGVVLYVVPRIPLPEVPYEVAGRLTTKLAQYGIMLSMQFEAGDGQNIVDAIGQLQPVAINSIFPLEGKPLEAAVAADILQIYLGSENIQAPLRTLNNDVGEMWVDHLLSRGHRRLAFAYSQRRKIKPLGDYWLSGLQTAAAGHGLDEIAIETIATDGSDVEQLARAWMSNGVTAVCTQNDETALVLLMGMREAGLSCPQDLAVISADAGPPGDLCQPALTSVAFDPEAIAEASATAILADLGHKVPEPGCPPNFMQLMTRAST
jgi:DNA-binding LacI/PurR family transcriptional regulator